LPKKVYYPREGKPKVLTANTPQELEALLRIGWTTDDPTKKEK